MRALPRTVAVLAIVLAASSVHAEPAPPAPIAPVAPIAPTFEIRDRGDAVEVIAHNVKAVRTAILPVRSRLEIPIAAGPAAKRITPGDATVKLVELDGGEASRMLSVKLGFERLDVKTLARFAQAIQVGDDLHVIVPRKVPVDGVAPALPEPTALAAAASKVAPPAPAAPVGPAPDPKAAIAKVEAVVAKVDAKIEPTKPIAEIKPEPKPDAPAVLGPSLPVAAPAAKPEPARPAAMAKPAADKPLPQVLAPEPDDAWSKVSLYGALGLAAIGGGIWMMRRRKALAPTHASIEVIAQRSLGGKARIVWLSAGTREMIVSVTAQQVRMLDQWAKADPAEAPIAHEPAERTDMRHALMEKLIEKSHSRPDDEPALDQPDPLAIAAHLPRSERRTGQFTIPERRTGAFTAEPGDDSYSDGPAPPRRTGAYAAVAAPSEPRRTGAFAAVTAPSEPPRRRTGAFAAGTAPASPRRTGAFAAVDKPADTAPADRPVSAAVSGILRLRGRTGQMPAVSEDIATGDVEADELWAREILAATGGRR